ncbi:ABC transporter substrate-binding protein [Massiliimalia massiliensis]|uniref:ABC transporter substrate-binding protein n=1 Tax=Massiliimalia massiliensis TaxID=1852384 RepID=UPI0009858962|nr:ABC transporter substrate-binding protein [Massiliimalia massiliensis]
MYKIILKQQIVLFGFLLILCAVLSGCTYQEQSSEQKASPFPVVINHITLYGEPESVVSLADPITEALQSLGFSDKLAGINTDCELEGLDELPAAGTAEQPDITAILEIGPDLLITNIPLPTGNMEKLSEGGVKVLVLSEDESGYEPLLKQLAGKETAENS